MQQQALLKKRWRALELEGIRLDALNSTYATLMAELDQLDAQVAVTMTNQIEVDNNLLIHSIFLETVGQYYQAQLVKGEALGTLRLTNSLEFKGKWTDPFYPHDTVEQPFTLPNGMRKPCSMMRSLKQDWAYYQNERFQLVKLPYGEQRVSMYVLLPDESTNLSGILEEALTPESWASWLNCLVETEGDVRLPRFLVDYSIGLMSILRALGMGIAFDFGLANFAALSASPVVVKGIGQKVHIEVDEEGTRASALSLLEAAVGITEAITFHMVVDRSFLYVIQDDLTGLLLFVGLVVDPEPLLSTTWEQWQNNALLDALAVIADCMERGLSFEEALGNVRKLSDNPVGRVLERIGQIIQLGMSRDKALQLMVTERTDLPGDLAVLLNRLIQADQAKENLLDVVRAHAHDLWVKQGGAP